MSRERIFFYSLLGLTIFFALLVLVLIIPFITPILWAVIFSLITYPIHIKLSKSLKSESLSAFIITSITLLFIVIPFLVIGLLAVNQAIEITKSITDYLQSHTLLELLNNIYKIPYADRVITPDILQRAEKYVKSEEFRSILTTYGTRLTQKVGEVFTSMLFAIGSVIFKTFVFLTSFFFILRDGKKFLTFIERFFPMDKEDLYDVLLTIYKTVLAVVYGSVGVAIAQGVLGFVAYFLLGLKYSLVWAVLTSVASLVPPFGAGVVWFPIAVYLFIEKGILHGIFMLIWGGVVISTIDNIIRPIIMKKGIDLPYIVLFFSTVGGLLTFGFVGLFLGPILFTTFFSLVLIYEKRVLKGGQ